MTQPTCRVPSKRFRGELVARVATLPPLLVPSAHRMVWLQVKPAAFSPRKHALHADNQEKCLLNCLLAEAFGQLKLLDEAVSL